MKKFFYEIKKEMEFSKRKSNLNFPAHIHESVELIYLISGTAKAFCNGKSYNLKEGNFFIVFPNQIHYYSENSSDCNFYSIIIKPNLLMNYANSFTSKIPASPLYNCQDENSNLIKLLNIAYEEYTNKTEEKIVVALLTSVFGMLLSKYELISNTVSGNFICELLNFCANHYKEDISIDEIAEKLHISRSYISHTFNDKLNMGFCDYINSLRLSEAVSLLENEKLSITEISILSGFSTIRTFNRAFMKHYGISPSKYRNAQKSQ